MRRLLAIMALMLVLSGYSAPSRSSYSAPSRSSSSGSSSYSAPRYSAPSRGYSAPARPSPAPAPQYTAPPRPAPSSPSPAMGGNTYHTTVIQQHQSVGYGGGGLGFWDYVLFWHMFQSSQPDPPGYQCSGGGCSRRACTPINGPPAPTP